MNPKLLLSLPKGAGENYINAFSSFGFSLKAEYLASDLSCDGLVLCGGGDIDPSYFGEEVSGSFPADRERDKKEFFLFDSYRSFGRPVFGICRGMQIINVAMGGTLYQHLENSMHHIGNVDICHAVKNIPETPAHCLFGEKSFVNSAHHQACKKIGQGLSIMQMCDDVAEGIYAHNIIGVQWHPERMTGKYFDKKYTDPAPIFEFFLKMFG